MVALAIGIKRVFPVGGDRQYTALHRLGVLEFEQFELRRELAQMRVDIHRRIGRRLDEDKAEPFCDWHGKKMIAFFERIAESLPLRHADKLALHVERPAVEPAGHQLGSSFAFAHETRAAMGTDVQKAADDAIGPAHYDNRHARFIEQTKTSRPRKIAREARHDRRLPEQPLPFGSMTRGVSV